ncbi:hypothetical protein ACFE04_017563 [Oxalis oulophora]
MRFIFIFIAAAAAAAAVLLLVLSASAHTLKLERGIPAPDEMELSQLIERDRLRHYGRGRLLQSNISPLNGVVDFPVDGTYDPFLVGLYYTKLQLGTPPRDFYVQIDSGSDVLWVSCNSCNGCPTTSGLQIPLNFFDPGSSSTASMVPCSDQRCSLGEQSADSACSSITNQCSYTFQYGDGSGTQGYYVSDLLYFDTIVGDTVVPNSTASVVFGCSTVQTGDLTKSDRAVDGIFGFGPQELSVMSQLASQGLTPRVFSHCLRGGSGGGTLVLGEIMEPNIVYTPLVPSQPHYNLNLLSISVNGQTLAISSSVFQTSSNQGTIIDSGTTLAYLPEAAYDPFVTAISSTVSQSARAVLSRGNQCFLLTSSSVTDIFPQVSFNFAQGASLVLSPLDYMIQQNSIGGTAVWCIGFSKNQVQEITILGDLVLKDKIFVYDLAEQRIGWANYDCSMAVNVSAIINSGKSEYVNAGQVHHHHQQQLGGAEILGWLILFMRGDDNNTDIFFFVQPDFVPRDPNAKPINYKYPEVYNPYGPKPPPSDKVTQLADRIAALTTEERVLMSSTLTERLRHPKLQEISSEATMVRVEYNNIPMKLKRKDFGDHHVSHDFPLSYPARKIRRLDADLRPMMEEVEPEIPVFEETPSNEERAIVVFKPVNVNFPYALSITVDPDIISAYNRSTANRVFSSSDEQSEGNENKCLAVVPYAPLLLPKADIDILQPEAPDTMEANEYGAMAMDVEEEDVKNETRNDYDPYGLNGTQGFSWQQQQHCFMPQPPPSVSTPITWFR